MLTNAVGNSNNIVFPTADMQILYLDENSSDSASESLCDAASQIELEKDSVALYNTCPVSFAWLKTRYSQYQTVIDDEGERLVYYVIPYAAFMELKSCQDVELKDVLTVSSKQQAITDN